MSATRNSSPPRWRLGFVLGVMGAAVGALLWRAVDLHVFDKEFLQTQGDARHLRVVSIPAHRGVISDRHGEPLAISTPVDSVWAHPGKLAEAPERWEALGRTLGTGTERVRSAVERGAGREFVYLDRHVEPSLAQRVMELEVPGVALQREYRRYYPAGEVAAHVIGFTNIDDVGQEGIERLFDDQLRGVPGAKRVMRDRLGRVVENVESIRAPSPGRDLTLSIDRRIQYLAYRELKAAVARHRAQSGSAVVLDAHTGEVLAMVNQPAYNPNKLSDRTGSRPRNRAVTDVFEPGSTVKPFTVAAAIASGRYRPDSVVDTAPGYYSLAGFTIRDHRNYGQIDVATVIQKSSNVGASRIAMSLDPRRLWELFYRVGFGHTTGSGFPGEADGHMKDFHEWYPVEQATFSYGYGLNVSALQLARAYSVLASGGRARPISFLRLAPGEVPAGDVVMSEKTADSVRAMLEAAVAPGGTGTKARVLGYRVAGKTGTVRKAGRGGYVEDAYISVFAGMAPASRPRLVMVVKIDEPDAGEYYGGSVAAPVFSTVMDGALRLLNVPPDDIESLEMAMAEQLP